MRLAFYLRFLYLLLTGTLVVVPAVSAHVLVTNSKIGAVMHIDPEDDPIMDQNAVFYFDFKDPDNKFKINNCDCKVTIKKGDQQIFAGVLQPLGHDQNSGSFNYVFTQKGDYIVSIDGDPLKEGDFAEFGLTFPVSVNRQAQPTVGVNSAQPHNTATVLLLVAGGVGILTFFIGLSIFQKLK